MTRRRLQALALGHTETALPRHAAKPSDIPGCPLAPTCDVWQTLWYNPLATTSTQDLAPKTSKATRRSYSSK